ncbi:MAG: hypothetical protein GXO03_02700 [Aquificae bacterium]|nr:hypothetical protein [Aquificota bacterium]
MSKVLLEGLLLFVFYALVLLVSFKDAITKFYPATDLWVILAHSQSFNPGSWFLEGYREYFTLHGELSYQVYHYVRPVFNFLTWLLYELSGGRFYLFPVAGLLFHALSSALAYGFVRRFVTGSRGPALLVSFIVFTFPEGAGLAYSWDFAQDTIAFTLLLAALTLYLSGRKGLAFALNAVGLLTKEQFLLFPVLTGLRELFLRRYGWAAAFLLSAAVYVLYKLAVFGAVGSEKTVGLDGSAPSKLPFVPLVLVNLELYFFHGFSLTETVKLVWENSSVFDKLGLILNALSLFMLIAGLALRRVSPFLGGFAVVYDAFPLLVKTSLGGVNLRFVLYGRFFTLAAVAELLKSRPALLYGFLAAVLLVQLHTLFLLGGFSGLASVYAAFREECRVLAEELKACSRGGRVYLIGKDACFNYGVKGVAAVLGLRGEVVPVFNFLTRKPAYELLKLKNDGLELRVKLRSLAEFFGHTANMSPERVFKRAERDGRTLRVKKEGVVYEIKLAKECKELKPSCRVEEFKIKISLKDNDAVFLVNDRRSSCVYASTQGSTASGTGLKTY